MEKCKTCEEKTYSGNNYYILYQTCNGCGVQIDIKKGLRKRCSSCKSTRPIEKFETGYKRCKKCVLSRRRQAVEHGIHRKVDCGCGSSYRKDGKSRHVQSKKHLIWEKSEEIS